MQTTREWAKEVRAELIWVLVASVVLLVAGMSLGYEMAQREAREDHRPRAELVIDGAVLDRRLAALEEGQRAIQAGIDKLAQRIEAIEQAGASDAR